MCGWDSATKAVNALMTVVMRRNAPGSVAEAPTRSVGCGSRSAGEAPAASVHQIGVICGIATGGICAAAVGHVFKPNGTARRAYGPQRQ
ncbi:hypothetical protein KCP69_10505 [Salmonella enterica subsp. enterica]|nr:hypothetical protein KCP69_10505 [Salmonella enterica subsp. enterica]